MPVDRFSPLDSRSERHLLRSRHPNVLIVGGPGARTTALRQLRPFLRHPVVTTSVAGSEVASSGTSARTLVLEHVAELSLSEQTALLAWLEASGDRTQVITTADRSLLPLVRKGQFLEALYYRLNIVYLDLTA